MINLVRKIFKVFSDNGLFDEGVQLIGSWCFKLYQDHLGVPKYPLLTQDIDFLIPYPFHGRNHEDFINQLVELGFNCDHHSDGSLYLWSAEFKIEFLTPEKGRGVSRPVRIKELGFPVVALRFISLLLDNPIKIKEGNIQILVPNPANYCLHKLMIAGRRKNVSKGLKDLQQAIYTSVIVEEKALVKLFNSFPKKWKISILEALKKARNLLPLEQDKIEKLEFTLQDSIK